MAFFLAKSADQNSMLKNEVKIIDRELLATNERTQKLEAVLQDIDRLLSVQTRGIKERLDKARGENACNQQPEVSHLFVGFSPKTFSPDQAITRSANDSCNQDSLN
jgi:CHASE2 domain-containing sensor protein